MSYLTFERYQILGGKIDSTAFERLSYRCTKLIDKRTFDRLKTMEDLPKDVEMLAFELVELYAKTNTISDENEIKSMQNNGVSVEYVNKDTATLESEIQSLIRLYLGRLTNSEGMPLLYSGVDNVTFCR